MIPLSACPLNLLWLSSDLILGAQEDCSLTPEEQVKFSACKSKMAVSATLLHQRKKIPRTSFLGGIGMLEAPYEFVIICTDRSFGGISVQLFKLCIVWADIKWFSFSLQWMKSFWKSDACYAQYGVDGSDCSFRIYLSEVSPLPSPPLNSSRFIMHWEALMESCVLPDWKLVSDSTWESTA